MRNEKGPTVKGQKRYNEFLTEYREQNIPKEYNQIQLVDELLNPELDHYIEITNRSDGKSFNYIGFFIALSLKFELGFLLISRTWSIRHEYEVLLSKIADTLPALQNAEIDFFRHQFYISVLAKNDSGENVIVGLITDLNNATNLKYSSNLLSDYPIIIYDEFLALEGDYLPDEWPRLKTIYGSVNRNFDLPFIQYPRLFYLGNAVNFSSPVLSALNLYQALEDQELNTVKQYENVLLSIGYNEQTNVKRNLRAFDEEKDKFTYGQFEVNNYALITKQESENLARVSDRVVVKLEDNFLLIDYNEDLINLSIVGYTEEPYTFNRVLKDNREGTTYLDQSFFTKTAVKRHDKGLFRYDNNFSKDFITTRLPDLNLHKIIVLDQMAKNSEPEELTADRRYTRQYMELTKRRIYERLNYGY